MGLCLSHPQFDYIQTDSGCRLCRKRASGESIRMNQRLSPFATAALLARTTLSPSDRTGGFTHHYEMHLMFSILVCNGLEVYERNENFRTTPKLPLTATPANELTSGPFSGGAAQRTLSR